MKKECPSCAMEIDSKSKECPICGYEFGELPSSYKWIAIALILLIIIYAIL